MRRLGTTGVLVIMLCAGAAVWWNMCGQGPYADSCQYALGCKSFYCVHHGLRGSNQVTTPTGMCTKSCDADRDCGSGALCVKLSDDAREDLPPFGKPEKACMKTVELQGDTTRH